MTQPLDDPEKSGQVPPKINTDDLFIRSRIMTGGERDEGSVTSEKALIARKTLQIIPFVMRVMAAEMRLSQHGFLSGHLALLGTLDIRSYTLKDLAELHSVSAPTMSGTVNTLEERGWVTRARDAKDRRIVWVALAPQGKAVLESINAQVEARIAALLEGLSPEAGESLSNGLTILQQLFIEGMINDPILRET